jgi:torulene dioxygenase
VWKCSFNSILGPDELTMEKVMSIFRPASAIENNDPSLVNVSVTIKPNMPGLPPHPTSSREIGHSTTTGIKSLWAATDAARLKQLDPKTLSPLFTTTQASLHPLLKGPLSGAHSQTDSLTEDVFNYNLELGLHATYRIFRTSALTRETEILATFQAKAAYIHSFFLSEDYVILAIWSSRYEKNGLKIPIEQNLLDAIAPFSAEHLTHWYVIDRKHGQGLVTEFESPASFCFHTINAWQESNESGETDILAELVEFENLNVLHNFYYENLTSSGANAVSFHAEKGNSCIPRLVRYRLSNIPSLSLKRSSHSSAGIRKAVLELTVPKLKVGELPTINPKFVAKEHRYVYGIVNRGYSSFLDGICKTDTKTGEAIYWDERGCTPGEAIFVLNPKGESEDDGVLLSVVLDGRKVGEESSFLLVLDAKNLQELGRAEVNGVVGLGFHGVHVPLDLE